MKYLVENDDEEGFESVDLQLWLYLSGCRAVLALPRAQLNAFGRSAPIILKASGIRASFSDRLLRGTWLEVSNQPLRHRSPVEFVFTAQS